MTMNSARPMVRDLPPLHPLLIEPLVRAALVEDLGRAGDITTDAVVPADAEAEARFVARQGGVVAGLDLAALAFRLVDPRLDFRMLKGDGSAVEPGRMVAIVTGPARGILTAERTALNFVSRMSGIASATAAITAAIAGHKARIVCTRKTTPGLRAIEKYAVLDDAVLIKDNHIAIAGGVRPALERARAAIGHLVKIEIEVDTLRQLDELLAVDADAVLLDNMDVATLAEAVEMVGGRMITEASGRVDVKSAPAIAGTGVDLISVGWLTHSAPILDIGLDF